MQNNSKQKETMTVLSLVVPCYNEEETIPQLYQAACEVLEKLIPTGITAEFVFVNDGSTDNTENIIIDLAGSDERVRYVSFSRNFGKEAALLAGLQKAAGCYVVVMDADLQDPPEFIPQMLEAVASGEYDCAGMRRITRKGEPLIRSFFSRMFYRILGRLADIEVTDGVRDFRLMNRAYVNAVISLRERSRFSKGIFPWVGFRTKLFEYKNIQRTAGGTKWSFWKLFFYSLDGIIAFSTKPLAIVSVLGLLLFFISVIFILFIIIRKIVWGDPVAGWASTACIVLACSGMQLLSTGILGAYLSKAYTEIKQRPHYIVKSEK